MTQHYEDNIAKSDIILVLRPMEGKKPLNSSGDADPRMFTGENNLHVKMDTQTCLWSLHFDKGLVPPIFRQQFTNFTRALTFVKDYYARRNIEVTEIKN